MRTLPGIGPLLGRRLVRALHERRLDRARSLLRWGADPNTRYEGRSALSVAIDNHYRLGDSDNLPLVRALLARGADANARVGGSHILFQAIKVRAPAVVAELLTAGADVNVREEEDPPRREATPLLQAIKELGVDPFSEATTVRQLLAAGAEVDAPDGRGYTALMRAADSLHVDAVRALVDAGADVDARSRDGMNALMLCNTPGLKDSEPRRQVSQLLMAGGADTAGLLAQSGMALLSDMCRRGDLFADEEEAIVVQAVERLKEAREEGSARLAEFIVVLLEDRSPRILTALRVAQEVTPIPALLDAVRTVLRAPALGRRQAIQYYPSELVGATEVGWADQTARKVRDSAARALQMLATC